MNQAVEERTDGRATRDGNGNGNGGISIGDRHILTASPLIWILLAAAVGWAIWATVTRSAGSGSATGVRAVVVATAGADRMLVVLGCPGSGSQGGSKRPAAGGSVVLPRDSGNRVVLVPGCKGGGSGGAGGGSQGGSPPVQVLSPGAPVPKQGGKVSSQYGGSGSSQGKVRNVFQVPASGAPRLIVVPPCIGSKGGSGAQASPVSSGRGVLVAPPCGSASGSG